MKKFNLKIKKNNGFTLGEVGISEKNLTFVRWFNQPIYGWKQISEHNKSKLICSSVCIRCSKFKNLKISDKPWRFNSFSHPAREENVDFQWWFWAFHLPNNEPTIWKQEHGKLWQQEGVDLCQLLFETLSFWF